MRSATLPVLAALLAAHPAMAQETRPPRGVTTRIIARPSPADIAAAFPAPAKARGVAGRAMLDCEVTAEFGLGNCSVRSETPADMGFGAAAVGLARLYRLDPVDYWGRPVLPGDHLYFGVVFPIEGQESPPPPAGLPIGPPPGGMPRPPPPPGFVKITQPIWTSTPAGEAIAAAYPKGAGRQGGRAVIECRVTAAGAVTACAILSETPAGQGFGAAAVSLAPQYRIQTTNAEGQSVIGNTVQISVAFQAR